MRVYPVILVWLFLASCGKECTTVRPKMFVRIGFLGFDTTEVDTILFSAYATGSGFTTLLRRDTMTFSAPLLAHDTIYPENRYIYNGNNSRNPETFQLGFNDCLLVLPATGDSFRISDLRYSDDSLYRYTAPSRIKGCTLKPSALQPERVTVNGQTISPQTSKVGYYNVPVLTLIR